MPAAGEGVGEIWRSGLPGERWVYVAELCRHIGF